MKRALRIALAGILAAAMIVGCTPKPEVADIPPATTDAPMTPPAPDAATATDAVDTGAPAAAPATDATATSPAPADPNEGKTSDSETDGTR